MGTSLPVIRGTSTALYPFTQTYIANTGKSDAQNGSATRWVKSPPIVRFELPFQPVTQAQKNALKSAFASAKGQFTTNLQFTSDQAYTNLSFDADEFSAAEQVSTVYGVRWALTQAIPQSFSPGASGGAFPALSTGAIGQLPYQETKRWQTAVSKVAAGPKYGYAEFAGGLANFPSDGLMAWDMQCGNLKDTEVSAIVAHWLANWGDAFPFTFTDESGTNYTKVYYGSPQLTIRRNRANSSAVQVSLVQTF